MQGFFKNYETGGFFDEMFHADGSVRAHYETLLARFGEMDQAAF